MQDRRQDPQTNDSIRTLIRIKVWRFSHHPALREWTAEDLSQELELCWHLAKDEFDASRGDILTYADFVFNNFIQNLIKFKKAGKRDYRRCTQSLDDDVDVRDDSGLTRHEVYSHDSYFNATGGRHPGSGQLLDLRLDLNEALGKLPSHLRELAIRRASQNVTDTAAAMGISRRTAYAWQRQIAAVLRQSGLTDYLPHAVPARKKRRPAGLHILRKSCSEGRKEES